MRDRAKMNAMRSGVVVVGAMAFGYLTLYLGFKPFLEKAQLSLEHSQSSSLNPEIMTWQENQEDHEEEEEECVYYSKHHVNHSATSVKGKKRDAPVVDLFRGEFEGIREAISSGTEAIREGNAIAKRSRAHVYSEEEVFSELVNIGVDERLRYKAYTFLTRDAMTVRAFFGCPVGERKNFLLQLMYGTRNL